MFDATSPTNYIIIRAPGYAHGVCGFTVNRARRNIRRPCRRLIGTVSFIGDAVSDWDR